MTHHPRLKDDALTTQFAGSRCLVTGGAGFIGSNLVKTLNKAGAIVTVIDNFSTGQTENLPSEGVRLIRGDISQHPQFPELVREADYLFHMAAQVGNVKSLDRPVPDALTNIVGTVRMLEAARDSSLTRIVYSSSSAIFGEAERLPIDEDHPQKPASFYALSKQTGEKYSLLAASLWNVPVVCLRYFNVFGYPSEDSDYSGVISIFFKRLTQQQPILIYGDGDQSRDFIFVQDIVQAILRAATLGVVGQTYNIGTGKATSIAQLAAAVFESTGMSVEIQKKEPRAGEVRHSVADISKARHELAFDPQYDLISGLREYWTLTQGAARASLAVTGLKGTPTATKILVLVQDGDECNWLASFRFEQFGYEAVCLSTIDPPDEFSLRTRRLYSAPDLTGHAIPDFAEIVRILREERPAVCLLLGAGVCANLLRAACEIESVLTFSVVTSEQDYQAIPIANTALPHGFFLASTTVLTRALSDPRYGSTLVPTGHPAIGDEAEKAADRMLSFIGAFAEGGLDVEGPQLSIIIPAFNEESNLEAVCDRLLGVFEGGSLSFEILLIDDASSDGTYEAAVRQMWKSPRIRAFTKPTPRGMGNAIIYGLERARAPVIAVTMADGSDQVERIPDMYRAVTDQGFGLVIGSRYRKPDNYQAIPMMYRFWSRCFRLSAWTLAGLRLSDYTNAFRVFDRRIFARYGAESGGFEISPEITFKAWFATHRVGEIDVRQLKRASGQSKFSFLRAGPGYGRMLIKALVNRLTGRWFTLDW